VFLFKKFIVANVFALWRQTKKKPNANCTKAFFAKFLNLAHSIFRKWGEKKNPRKICDFQQLEEFEKKEKPYLNQCFFCQFCDVAKEAMIHKKN